MTTQQEALEALVSAIIDAAHPLRIIVFGSAARERVGPASDIDLLIPDDLGRGEGSLCRLTQHVREIWSLLRKTSTERLLVLPQRWSPRPAAMWRRSGSSDPVGVLAQLVLANNRDA